MSALQNADGDQVYVSITGLTLKKWWHIVPFYRKAVPAFKQARQAAGNLSAEVRTVGKMHCTLTVWENRKAMSEFLYAGAHHDAIAIFNEIATGKTYGYETTEVPNWDEAVRLLDENGKVYGAA